MPAGILAALSGALPLARCFVRSEPPTHPSRPGNYPEAGRTPRADAPANRVRAMLRTAWRRYRTRQCLVGMSAYLLKDIGVSFAEAEAEANKPFWIL